jgi:hypothetical protein
LRRFPYGIPALPLPSKLAPVLALLLVPLLLAAGCAKQECTAARDVRLDWDASHDTNVNAAGGGFRVQYGTSSDLSGAVTVDLPYVSGSSPPLTTTLPSLGCGTWHVRVTAYSALSSSGGSTDLTVSVE